jgi:SpoVK/Ycf46/Vps4 family AAA+-type ATPase
MLSDLIQSNIPLIFVETDEPYRVEQFISKHDKDLFGRWNKKGIEYYIGNSIERIKSTTTMEAALEYLSTTRKHYLIVLHGKPEYELLLNMPEYHTLIFVNSEFADFPGAVHVRLPPPDTSEYLQAFKDKTKLARLYAEYSIGMKVKDAVNCYKYSKHTKTDFLQNKKLFTNSIYLDIVLTKNTFDILGGFYEFKTWFSRCKHWYKYKNLPKQKGVLLYGDSGTGKSLCASCLGNEADLPLYRFDITRVYDEYVGKSENKIREALKAIEKTAPSIVWVEEIGRLFSGQAHIAHNQVLALLLEWMQENDKDIFMVATANQIDQIPPELIRPGRFSAKFKVERPSIPDAIEIFKIHADKYNIDFSQVDSALKNLRVDYTGAEIGNIVEEAVIIAHAEGISKEESLRRMFE